MNEPTTNSPVQSSNSPEEDAHPDHRADCAELIRLTDEFCTKYLNDEYRECCRGLAVMISRKGSPVGRGKLEGWAAGIVSTIGWVNFLGDPSQQPHMKTADIAKCMGVSMATMAAKARVIREGLKIVPLDPEFTLPSRLDDNPLVWMLELKNGMIVDVRKLPREAQVAAYENGMIPYVPADRTGKAPRT